MRAGGRWSVALAVAIAVAVVVGILFHFWFLWHRPINSDEAVPGLMAQGSMHGRFGAFYWGQWYGGSAETLAVAAAVALFGSTGVVLGFTATVLAALASVTMWRVARRVVHDPRLAALVGALSWAGSEVVISDSSHEWGFRRVTLLAGVLCLWLALRILDGNQGLGEFAFLGFFAGIGWWSSPEIVYFAVPTALLILSAATRGVPEYRRHWRARVLTLMAAGVVGALPWLWSNLRDGFRSFEIRQYVAPDNAPGYLGHLGLFFSRSYPMLLGARYDGTGELVGGVPLEVLLGLAVAGAVLICLLHRGRTRILALGVVLFPFLYAASPATWWWQDGRYVAFLWPMLCLLVIAACELLPQTLRNVWPSAVRRARGVTTRAVALLVVSVALILCLAGFFVAGTDGKPATLVSNWSDPDAPSAQAAQELVADHLDRGFANYWMAYKLDYLSDGKLLFTPPQWNSSRNATIYQDVDRSTPQSWLFVAPGHGDAGERQFSISADMGVPGQSEASFVAQLQQLGVTYQVQSVGILLAVTPSRNVVVAQDLKVSLAHAR